MASVSFFCFDFFLCYCSVAPVCLFALSACVVFVVLCLVFALFRFMWDLCYLLRVMLCFVLFRFFFGSVLFAFLFDLMIELEPQFTSVEGSPNTFLIFLIFLPLPEYLKLISENCP